MLERVDRLAAFVDDHANLQRDHDVHVEQQAEILAKIVSRSIDYYEVPINYNGRSILEGKKIRWYHIFSVIREIVLGKIR